jgi:proline dehydrogenase
MSTLWQQVMVRVARWEALPGIAQRQPWMTGLAARFTGGPDASSAIAAARELRADGISASLFYLGEYVRDPAIVATTVGRLRDAIEALADAGLDVNTSVDPTQLGLMISEDTCEANLRQVADAVARVCSPAVRPGRDAVMLDMEDAGTTETTLALYDRLRHDGLPVAVTIQAYLHRTEADLQRVASSGGWIRLVKGAFAEPATIAARRRAEISQRYRHAARVLLSPVSRDAGCYPSFATHDDLIIEDIIQAARAQAWPPDHFEFEMLHGVRPDLQRALARRGYQVRVYLPFGTDWFRYAIRRIGESPRNLRFAVSAITHAAPAHPNGRRA